MTISGPARPRRSRASPGTAALLSFVVPGAGQIWSGATRRGIVLALPFALLVVATALAAATVGNPAELIGLLLQPASLAFLLVANLVLLAYRAWAILDAYRTARRAQPPAVPRPAAGTIVLGVLLAVSVALHGTVAYVGWNTYDLMTGVFGAARDGRGPSWGDDEPDATAAGRAPSPSPSLDDVLAPTPRATVAPPTPPPVEPPYWAEDGRLNVLLLGGDAGPGRDSLRTDTMILVTVDVATARAAMFGIPRNLTGVPLPEPYASHFQGGRFPDLLNAMWRYADERAGTFPGNDETRGFRALAAAIEHLTGVSIDGIVSVDMGGFVRLIDAVGGVAVDVPERVRDPQYPNESGIGTRVVDIPAGVQRMDGSMLLAYARTRRQDSDYGRMGRQQTILLALRDALNPCSLLPRLPELVAIAKDSLWTNIPLDELPQLLALAERIETDRIESHSFTPARGYPAAVTDASIARMRRAVREAFAGVPPPSEGPDWDLLRC